MKRDCSLLRSPIRKLDRRLMRPMVILGTAAFHSLQLLSSRVKLLIEYGQLSRVRRHVETSTWSR